MQDALYNAQGPERPNIVILISGSGSNMMTLVEAAEKGDIDANISAVISNKPDAAGLQKAKDKGIETASLDHTEYSSRDDFDVALMRLIDDHQPDLVVLAGFMRILTPAFVQHYHGCMLNIHPSLLPKYQGLNTHQRALDNGDSQHGASVHFVTEELDGGPVVVQAVVPIETNDTEGSLQQRVLVQEHLIYPIVVKWFVEGRLTLKGEHACFDGKPLPDHGLALGGNS